MGDVVGFPKRHVRASSTCFAARRAKRSADNPASLARPVAKTRVHHSEGIVSRFHHLITDQFEVPTSEAIASRDGHKSMTDLNVVKAESVSMPGLLGPIVPNIKVILSHDSNLPVGHSGLMAQDVEEIAESEWREGFRQRIREAQGNRTQEQMATLLGITRERWAKIVGARGTGFPIRLLTKFCMICDRDLVWLLDGPSAAKASAPASRKATTQPTKRRMRA